MGTPLAATREVARSGPVMALDGAARADQGDRPGHPIWLDGPVGELAAQTPGAEQGRRAPRPLVVNGRAVPAPAAETVPPRAAQQMPGAGASSLLLAVEAGLLGQLFWLVHVHLAAGSPDRHLAFGTGLLLPLAVVVFFVVKRSMLSDGWHGLAAFRNSFRASLHGALAVTAVVTTILWHATATASTAAASGALGLAFAVATIAAFDWISAPWLRRRQAAASARAIQRIALLGHDRECRSLAARLDETQAGLRIVGIFALGEDATSGSAVRSSADLVDAVVRLARDGAIDEVVIVPRSLDDPLLVPAIAQLSAYSVDITLSPGAIGLAVADLACGPGAPVMPLLPLVRQSIRGWGADAKRALDVVVSGLAILALLPVFGLIALAIKLESPGPVLFKQIRTGLNQKPFVVWKFRTMRRGSDGVGNGFRQARRGDARVTRVGRLLRPLSIDEFHQLVNVLRGEMSLVGPRPHPVPLNERFAHQVALYSARHRVLPGMTGLAQIAGCRGETDTIERMATRLRYDLQYIRTWSLWLDLRIIALTLLGRFTHNNAY